MNNKVARAILPLMISCMGFGTLTLATKREQREAKRREWAERAAIKNKRKAG